MGERPQERQLSAEGTQQQQLWSYHTLGHHISPCGTDICQTTNGFLFTFCLKPSANCELSASKQELLTSSSSRFPDFTVGSTLGLLLSGLCPSFCLFSPPPHSSPPVSVGAGVQTCLPQIFLTKSQLSCEDNSAKILFLLVLLKPKFYR